MEQSQCFQTQCGHVFRIIKFGNSSVRLFFGGVVRGSDAENIGYVSYLCIGGRGYHLNTRSSFQVLHRESKIINVVFGTVEM